MPGGDSHIFPKPLTIFHGPRLLSKSMLRSMLVNNDFLIWLWCFLWSAPWINRWVNNREAGDLRRHRAHYDVIVMNDWGVAQSGYVFYLWLRNASTTEWICDICSIFSHWLRPCSVIVKKGGLRLCRSQWKSSSNNVKLILLIYVRKRQFNPTLSGQFFNVNFYCNVMLGMQYTFQLSRWLTPKMWN